jgi:hypothetical protein
MPIVISEFEIVPEPQPSAEPAPTPQERTGEQRLPTPLELTLALRHQARRDARVRAD